MNYNVDAMYNSLESTQDDLDTLYDRLRSLQRALYSASNGADAAAVTENDRAEIGRIAKDIITVNGDLAEAEQNIAKATGANALGEALGNLNIAKGNYQQAVNSFAGSASNSAALAQLLNKDYEGALKTLDAIRTPEFRK